MRKVYEEAKKKLCELCDKGITGNNLKAVGELVDICKDIENIWYWQSKRGVLEETTYMQVDGDISVKTSHLM